jgi:DNA polymerase I-like protein with 3'-5' exonuclease and polymerase domains
MTELTLLRRAKRAPRPVDVVLAAPTLADVQKYLPLEDRLWACDIETIGVDAADPACSIVGLGVANESVCYYFHLAAADEAAREYIKQWLGTVRLTAFNVQFEAGFLQAWTGRWLRWDFCSYAFFKNLSSEGYPGQSWSLETAQSDVLGWPESNKTVLAEALKTRGLTKARMAELPPEILGPYCAADADAAWQLYEELTAQCKWPAQIDYHQRLFLNEVRLLIAQQLRGIQVNQERLHSCHQELIDKIDTSMNAFLNHPHVASHIQAHNKDVHDVWRASEPPQYTKGGTVSSRWTAWKEREQKWMADKGFNPNSKQQLEVLFYEKLGFRPTKYTETGRRVVDRKVLPSLGEPGRLLNEYNLLVKRRGYVEAVIEKSRRDGCVHPQFNSVGTITTRLGGSGGLNLQQMPKKEVGFMAALAARPGYRLVQADAEALEPTILAEFSQDKTLLAIYGKDAKPNDIYLYVAAKISALGREIVKHYDPDNPTIAGIAAAKKHCKRDRDIAKTVQLASSYGAGPGKIHETLTMSGIDITFPEVRDIHREYWRLFSGVKKFEQQLHGMWSGNGGWIPSILGTPIPVADTLLKDIVNRFCQQSGHMVLQLWIWNCAQVFAERALEAHPWIVDLHDEMLWEVPEGQADDVADAIAEALRRTNAELDMGMPIKGPAQVVANLAEVKSENYKDWLASQEDEDDAA